MSFKLKNLLLLVLVMVTFRASAHQDIIYSIHKGNIHLAYLSGWEQLEVGNKIKIFLELSDKLIGEKFPNSEEIYIYFGHDYTKRDTSYYALGYGQFPYWGRETYARTNEKTSNGLKIIIRDRDFDIKKMLQLVNASFSNIDFIKTNQARHIVESKYYGPDTLHSIPFSQVYKFLSSSDATIEKLLGEKYYRKINKTTQDDVIDYYFQNNTFHFFYTTKKTNQECLPSQGKHAVAKTFIKDILTTDNILEIFGSADDGHFVFIDDSIFYFIPVLRDTVRGPFTIKNTIAGRPPITKYHHDYNPIETFTLFIDNYRSYEKVLFIPDSNFLVSNYGEIENAVISGLFKKADDQEINNNPGKTIAILTILLGLCLATISWLVTQRKYRKST